MLKGRKIPTSVFAIELNTWWEGASGISESEILFKYYVKKIDKLISLNNEALMAEFSEEIDDVKHSMLHQSEVNMSMNHFKQMLYESTFVSVNSYFQKKLEEIATIVKDNIKSIKKTYKQYKQDSDGLTRSDLAAYIWFIHNEVVEVSDVESLIVKVNSWNLIRNHIVHPSSNKIFPTAEFMKSNAINEIVYLQHPYDTSRNVVDFIFKPERSVLKSLRLFCFILAEIYIAINCKYSVMLT